MEGVPRMPMLSVELKFSPASTEFSDKILTYIAKHYQEDPATYRKEVDELNNLRENAIKASADFTGCSLLKKYFAQLHLLKSRFPMESNDEAAVSFTWYEKYSDMPNPITYDDIRYELACVLHNVGAMHSYLGSLDNRLSSEGMKIACTHFQCASWAFQHLSSNYNAAVFCTDFDKNILTWHTNLMLAQAQECILEKSLVDNRKYNIIAKIAVQVADFYRQCVKSLDQQSISDIVGGSRCKSWKKFVEMKVHYYMAIGYLYLGNQSEEIQKTSKEQKMGERIAYFQAANDHLVESLKLAQKESDAVKLALQFTNDVVGGKLTNAKKENDFIYHDKIPSLDSLPEVKGAALVKGIAFDPLDVEISGPDIFQKLIPLSVHQDSSLYSEQKAKLLRDVVDKIDKKNEQLTQYLAALQMDQLHLDDDFSQLPLPDTLLERCAAFNARLDPVPDLLAVMQKLSTLYSEIEYAMTELENQLNDAENDVKSNEETYGKCDDINALVSKLKELREDFGKYREANLHATKSNTELHKAMAAHSDNLKMLSLPLSELKKQLPAPAVAGGQTTEGGELKRIWAKVDEMKQQRDMLLDQLRKQVVDDDLTKILLATREIDPKEIFDKELKKHEKQIALIEQNLSAQENILKALTEANAKFATIRQQTSDVVKMRDVKILSLVAAYDVYVDLKIKSEQGIEFYKKFKKTLLEFNEKMAKFGENLNEVELKLQKNAEKALAAATAASAASMKSAQSATTAEPDGPKLKDYLAYYQSKKAMGAVPAASYAPPLNLPQSNYQSAAAGPQNYNYQPQPATSQMYSAATAAATMNPVPMNYSQPAISQQMYAPMPAATAATFNTTPMNYGQTTANAHSTSGYQPTTTHMYTTMPAAPANFNPTLGNYGQQQPASAHQPTASQMYAPMPANFSSTPVNYIPPSPYAQQTTTYYQPAAPQIGAAYPYQQQQTIASRQQNLMDTPLLGPLPMPIQPAAPTHPPSLI